MARPRLIALLLALLTLIVYLPVKQHAFVVYDDNEYVTENPIVQNGLTVEGLRWSFTSFHASNWHPLTWWSHMLDYELFGPDPGAHHLVNALWHAANAALLFLLLLRLHCSLWPAAVIAALFAWHPLHVESVAWVSERKDVLSTFFGLLSLLAYVRFAASRKDLPSAPRPGKGTDGGPGNSIPNPSSVIVTYAASLLLFALGLMAKPMLVTLPFVFLLLDYWPLRRISGLGNGPRLVLEKLPFFVLTAVSCVLTVLAQRAEAIVSFERLPLLDRFGNAVVAYARYLGKLAAPIDLSVYYPLHPTSTSAVFAAVMLLVTLSVLTLRARRLRPYLAVGWFWFLGVLVPVIGIVQVGGQAMADRYTYFSAIGIFLAVVLGGAEVLVRLRLKPRVIAVIAAIPLIACVLTTRHQLAFWRDSETLFTRALDVTRENDVAHMNLGVALEQQGRATEALTHYLEAMRINPRRTQVYNNLGNVLADLGRRDEALEYYRQAVQLRPDLPLPRLNLGTLLAELGNLPEATQQFTEAARLAPRDPRPHHALGRARLRNGQTAEAIPDFHNALSRDPDHFQTLALLARVLATDLSASNRNGVEAVQLAERANALTGDNQPLVLDTLAAAYAEAGRFAEAEATARRAIELATAAGLTSVAGMAERLRLYGQQQPHRESFQKTASPPQTSP